MYPRERCARCRAGVTVQTGLRGGCPLGIHCAGRSRGTHGHLADAEGLLDVYKEGNDVHKDLYGCRSGCIC